MASRQANRRSRQNSGIGAAAHCITKPRVAAFYVSKQVDSSWGKPSSESLKNPRPASRESTRPSAQIPVTSINLGVKIGHEQSEKFPPLKSGSRTKAAWA